MQDLTLREIITDVTSAVSALSHVATHHPIQFGATFALAAATVYSASANGFTSLATVSTAAATLATIQSSRLVTLAKEYTGTTVTALATLGLYAAGSSHFAVGMGLAGTMALAAKSLIWDQPQTRTIPLISPQPKPRPANFTANLVMALENFPQKGQMEELQNRIIAALDEASQRALEKSYDPLMKALLALDELDTFKDPLSAYFISRDINENNVTPQLNRFTQEAREFILTKMDEHIINAKNMAKEVEIMKTMPLPLQQLRLERLLSLQYEIQLILGDGDCGPRALAAAKSKGYQQNIPQDEVDQIRMEVVSYIPSSRFAVVAVDNHLDVMSQRGSYFTSTELAAYAEKEQQPVGVISIENVEVRDNKLCPPEKAFWGAQFSKPPILLFHRPMKLNGPINHYDLLRNKTN